MMTNNDFGYALRIKLTFAKMLSCGKLESIMNVINVTMIKFFYSLSFL